MTTSLIAHPRGEGHWDEPYPLLPSQHAEATRSQDLGRPERRLMLAILSDAIVLLQKFAGDVRTSGRREVRETERWILSDDQRWPCSFVNVCDALGLAHEPLRRMLMRWKTSRARTIRATRRRLLAGKAMQPLARTA